MPNDASLPGTDLGGGAPVYVGTEERRQGPYIIGKQAL